MLVAVLSDPIGGSFPRAKCFALGVRSVLPCGGVWARNFNGFGGVKNVIVRLSQDRAPKSAARFFTDCSGVSQLMCIHVRAYVRLMCGRNLHRSRTCLWQPSVLRLSFIM